MLHPDLEIIVVADEEARAHVAAATGAAERKLEETRAARAGRQRERQAELARLLDAEIEAIAREADHAAGERQARRAAWLDERREAGEAVMGRAAELFAAMVRDGPGGDVR